MKSFAKVIGICVAALMALVIAAGVCGKSDYRSPDPEAVTAATALRGFEEKIFNRIKDCTSGTMADTTIVEGIENARKLASHYGFDVDNSQACFADFLCSGRVNPAADADCIRLLQLIFKK